MAEATLLESIELAIARAGEREVEVHARRVVRGLARFAENAIGQHGALLDVEVSVRVSRDRRVAQTTTSDASPDGIVRAIHAARDLSSLVPVSEHFDGFAPKLAPKAHPPAIAAATRELDAKRRADTLGAAFARAKAANMRLAGTYGTTFVDAAVATTAGQRIEASTAYAAARLFAIGDGGASGFGGAMHHDASRVDFAAALEHAMQRCAASAEARALEPTTYDVLLEPSAVAELLEWMGFVSFGAREVEQGTSFLAGAQNRRITGESITISDDPVSATKEGLRLPFDREGTPSERVSLIKQGFAQGPVYDRAHAAKLGARSTGHATMVEGDLSALPESLHLEPGDVPRESLLAKLGRGLLVSRLHYVNGLLDPRRALMTGMTRDGTFWIEDGRPVHAVRNLRFTDSILEAFARADGIGNVAEVVPAWWSDQATLHVPPVLVRGLRFTGNAATVVAGS